MNDLLIDENLPKEDLYSNIYIFNNGKLVLHSSKLDDDTTPFEYIK
jgi:hypothetical protein